MIRTLLPILLFAFTIGCWSPESHLLVDEDFTRASGALRDPKLRMLETNLPRTGLAEVPHRAGAGAGRALVRYPADEPQWPDGRLNIYANEVGQGMVRFFDRPRRLDPVTEVLFIEQETFADLALPGTNQLGTRVWIQHGRGPIGHRERVELSTHFTSHVRGSRQLWPTMYFVRDGRETWAMPEGAISRAAYHFYALAAEGRNEELHGPQAREQGIYWTWEGLTWPRGWAPPVGGGLFEPSENPVEVAERIAGKPFAVRAVYRQGGQPLDTDGDGEADSMTTLVEVEGPRHAGRISIQAPLPAQIDEVRLLLRSQRPADGDERVARVTGVDASDAVLGFARIRVGITRAADFNLDGRVDEGDFEVLARHFGKAEDARLTQGDATADGRVGIDDLFRLLELWQGTVAGRAGRGQWQALVDRESGHVVLVNRSAAGRTPLLAFSVTGPEGTLAIVDKPERLPSGWVWQADSEQIGAGGIVLVSGQVDLGRILPPGTDLNSLEFRYVTGFGRSPQAGRVQWQ